MSKETFRIFAQKHPELASLVLEGKISWQKLYEIYDIYGENNTIWNDYINQNKIQNQEFTSFKELFNVIKNIDMETLQKGVNNLQKTITIIQELGISKPKTLPEYKPKPMYQYFED